MAGISIIIIVPAAIVALSGLTFVIIWSAVRSSGRRLKNKFAALGELYGKNYAEIYAACSTPTSITLTDKGAVKTWQATGYRISLLFDDNDICLGKTS